MTVLTQPLQPIKNWLLFNNQNNLSATAPLEYKDPEK